MTQPDQQFEIIKKSPIPPRATRGMYPWGRLKVGESFFVANGTQSTLHANGMQWAKIHNSKIKFRSRVVTKDGVRGIQVWRAA